MIATALKSSRERMPLRDATRARVFTSGHVVLLPPSNQVDLEPAAFFVRSGSRPGPSTISRPFAARMFIAHTRFGARGATACRIQFTDRILDRSSRAASLTRT
jgi:hypothetical protein